MAATLPRFGLAIQSAMRLPGLDWLRAVAIVLVVLLHAAVPYTVLPMPGLAWSVRHPEPSRAVDAIFWAIGLAIMPVFFWLSGFGASLSLAHRGPREFWSTRMRRVFWPLVAFATVLLPIELYVWLLGWVANGELPAGKLRSLKLGTYHENLWGLSHLWYLQYLLIYSLMLLGWNRIVERQQPRPPSALTRAWSGFSRVLILFVLASTVLWWSPETLIGFQHGFLPVPAKLAFNGFFFAAGVATQRCGRMAVGHGWPAVCGAIAIFAVLLPLVHRADFATLARLDRLSLAVGLAGYCTLMTCGLWDACVRMTSQPSRIVTRLCEASFWIYLVHHPLVAIWQIGLRPLGWSAGSQFAITATSTLLMCLASYETLVRRTALGVFLDGHRPALPPIIEPAIAVPTRRAA